MSLYKQLPLIYPFYIHTHPSIHPYTHTFMHTTHHSWVYTSPTPTIQTLNLNSASPPLPFATILSLNPFPPPLPIFQRNKHNRHAAPPLHLRLSVRHICAPAQLRLSSAQFNSSSNINQETCCFEAGFSDAESYSASKIVWRKGKERLDSGCSFHPLHL